MLMLQNINFESDFGCFSKYEPHHDKNQQNDGAPSEDSDQPGHPPSLIRVFAERSMGS